MRSLYVHALRTSFGLGRTAKAMIFPWIVVGLIFLVATVLTAIRAQTGVMALTYWGFPAPLVVLPILFCAVVAPELVSRDLRGGVLPLYFSRPLTRWDYALAKLAALITAVFLLLAGPELLMFVGGAFTVDGSGAVWHEALDFLRGLAVAGVYAVVFASLSLLIASLAGRRAVAAAMIVAVFVLTTPVYGVLRGLASSNTPPGEPLTGSAATMFQLAGLVSPMTLVDGVGQWWFTRNPEPGPYGYVYGLLALGLVALSVLLLLVRYRKVAR
jgi:ABC-2 type transport system permease protein